MSRKSLGLAPLLLLSSLALSACSSLKSGYLIPTVHPEELPAGRPLCTECHPAKDEKLAYGRFDHAPTFGDSHRNEASQAEQVCRMCHAPKFCNDCHATRVELKPSLKNQTDPYRRMPHEGDYISRHRIDARVDPTPCFRCHGSPKTSRTCAPCHGK
jgi:hypothetical protein